MFIAINVTLSIRANNFRQYNQYKLTIDPKYTHSTYSIHECILKCILHPGCTGVVKRDDNNSNNCQVLEYNADEYEGAMVPDANFIFMVMYLFINFLQTDFFWIFFRNSETTVSEFLKKIQNKYFLCTTMRGDTYNILKHPSAPFRVIH